MVEESKKRSKLSRRSFCGLKKLRSVDGSKELVRGSHFSSLLYSFVPSFNEHPEYYIG